jgi:ubiquinone/menaquinone biosynthesis C-methylase UbiE
MMPDYYSEKLAAKRLKACYDIAPARVKQYLASEIEYVRSKINKGNKVLELGCGYGRVLKILTPWTGIIAGIDTSLTSLLLAKEMLSVYNNSYLAQMNAVNSAFPDKTFDVVLCIQNGISAFKVNRQSLIKEAVRITKSGGMALFSTYSENFQKERLDWFIKQAKHKLIGEIDFELSKNGSIVCKDGFISEIVTKNEFISHCYNLGLVPIFEEVDKSSLFCEIRIK